jgi:membrane protease YdiL (CAAX protease family)
VCGLAPALLNRIIWRNFKGEISVWLNLITLIAFNAVFLLVLLRKYQISIDLLNNLSFKGILLAIGCAILFYFLLDKLLDPFFDSIFTTSAEEYQKSITALRQYPVANFIRTCLLAPVVEEILIRGCILDSLQKRYGLIIALLVSSLVFAILHFNFVQTLSAIICGLILGLLYAYTGSLFACILAHFLYNSISYITNVLMINK